jgi:hypothetical protein
MMTMDRTDREVDLTLKAASGPIDDREFQELMFHRDQRRLLRTNSPERLKEMPTEDGKGFTQS